MTKALPASIHFLSTHLTLTFLTFSLPRSSPLTSKIQKCIIWAPMGVKGLMGTLIKFLTLLTLNPFGIGVAPTHAVSCGRCGKLW